MNYNIKGTNIAVTDELRIYAERQLAHASKLVGTDTTAHADIELEYDEHHEGAPGSSGKYRAEFTVSVSGTLYRASERGSTLHEAIDLAAGELLSELRQGKKKRLHTFRRAAVRVKEYLRGWRRTL
jgi:putative sigma-54 modulation protein